MMKITFQLTKLRFSFFHIKRGQSSEEEVLVWVFPSHESKTSGMEKPILVLPIHWIYIPNKSKKQHQVVEIWYQGG